MPIDDEKLLRLIKLHLSYEALEAVGVSREEVGDFIDRAARSLGVKKTRSRDDESAEATQISKVEVNPDCPLLYLYVDGASKGNPGDAGVGVVITDDDGDVLVEKSAYIGRTTNNVAEYKALILGLQVAEGFHPGCLIVRSASALLVNQIMGEYRVKSPDLKPLFQAACEDLTNFASWQIEYVQRKKNMDADRLASAAIRKQQARMRRPGGSGK